MTQLLDYHVGILRGYMLALNAPTQVLNALDVLLGDYRSKAGPEIPAEPAPVADMPKKMKQFVETIQPDEPVEKPEAEKKKYFWDSEDDAILEEMYLSGKRPKEISLRLNRTPASVSTRIAVRGLKRGA